MRPVQITPSQGLLWEKKPRPLKTVPMSAEAGSIGQYIPSDMIFMGCWWAHCPTLAPKN
jgi:hypothetical protein